MFFFFFFKVIILGKSNAETTLMFVYPFWDLLGLILRLLEVCQRLYEQIVNAEQHSKSGEIAAIKLPH